MIYQYGRRYIILVIITLLSLNLACALGLPFPERSQVIPTPTQNSNNDATSTENKAPESIINPTVEPTVVSPTETTQSDNPTPSPNNSTIETKKLAEKQLFILPGGEPPTLDPHLSGDSTSAEYVVEIFSGLMVYDQQLNLMPDLAESYQISDDGLVYTFKIRPTAQFQDGKAIRAADFKWSFERACDPTTLSPTADTYMGDIVGCRDKLKSKVKEVAGVKVVDDLTFQLMIDEPKAFFLAKMTYPTAYVLDRENVENGGADWYKKANGSGPFKLAEFSLDQNVIVLAKNENYYRDPKPILEKVIYLVNAPINSMTGYEQSLGIGENADTTYDAIEIGTNDLGRATDPNNPLSKELVTVNSLSIFYVGFNTRKPPFDDPKIRQAFNLALDKKRIVKLAFQGTVSAANGIVPPNMPGYKNPDLSDYEFDPEQARQLIADSSYGDPSELPDITLHVGGDGGAVGPVIESIVQSYKINLGVEIAVEESSWANFLNDLNRGDSSYQMYQLGWVADYPDPQNFLEVLFHSKSEQNHGGYNNPKLDQLLDQARATQDAESRLVLYQQAEQMILADAAWIPIYFSVENWLVKPYVQNFNIPPIKIPKLQYISIAEH